MMKKPPFYFYPKRIFTSRRLRQLALPVCSAKLLSQILSRLMSVSGLVLKVLIQISRTARVLYMKKAHCNGKYSDGERRRKASMSGLARDLAVLR
jgi:hypothetical protein